MTVPVYFKEMPTLRVKINSSTGELETEFYNLLLPHLVEEVRNETNYVAVSCFPSFFNHDLVKKEIMKYISDGIQNEDTKIYFDNVYEGHILSCIGVIQEIINELKLNNNNCYFITGAMNGQKFYNEYCDKNNILNKFNLIALNSWERHINYTTPKNIISEHEFIVEPKEKLFLCFNRIFRYQRLALIGLLFYKNLVDKAYYSFFPECTYAGPRTPNINELKKFIKQQDIFNIIETEFNKNYDKFPLVLNNKDASPTNYIMESDLVYYKNSYFSVIPETFFFSMITPGFDEHAVFFSEKIFKSIICKHPFILLNRPFSLQYLRQIGYKTFHPFIDESYDLIEDDEQRLMSIVNEIERLSKQTDAEWIEWLNNVKEIVNHNFNVLTSKNVFDHRFHENLNYEVGEFNK